MKKPARKAAPPAPTGPYMIGYARVSTVEQNLLLQRDALEKAGVSPHDIYVEKLSAKSKNRPALDDAIANLRPGDALVVWRLDRLARNMRELYRRLDQIHAAEASFRSLTEHFDFSTATGRFMLAIMGAMAEFEAQLIAARTSAGMRAARDSGKKVGAKAKFSPEVRKEVMKLLRGGMSARDVAKKYDCTEGTVYNHFSITYGPRNRRIVKMKEPRKSQFDLKL